MSQVLAGLLAACLVAASPAAAQEIVSFPDVPPSHWAHDAVDRVTRVGLIEGRPDGTFGGARPVTRYEFAVVMARVFERFGRVRPDIRGQFPDVPRGHWASLALGNTSRFGLFEGLPGGKFAGSQAMTRYSGAVAFERALSSITEETSDPLPRDSTGRLLKRPKLETEITKLLAEEFPDVELQHWARDAVARLYITGILEGNPEIRFRGLLPLTRYEMVIAVARLLNSGPVCVLQPAP
jgi:hypothetical protein